MSKEKVGWECCTCLRVYPMRALALGCHPPEKISYWMCDVYPLHQHLSEEGAKDCKNQKGGAE